MALALASSNGEDREAGGVISRTSPADPLELELEQARAAYQEALDQGLRGAALREARRAYVAACDAVTRSQGRRAARSIARDGRPLRAA